MEKFDWRFLWFFILPIIVGLIELVQAIKKDGWKDTFEFILYVLAMFSGVIGTFWLLRELLTYFA